MKSKPSGILKYAVLILLFVFEVVPILQVFINSLRTDADVKTRPFGLPDTWTVQNWPETWRIGDYGSAFLSTIFISAVVVLLTLTVVGLGAYALAKMEFRGREIIIAYFFVVMSLPGFLYIVPDFFIFNWLGVLNNRIALAVLYTAMAIPFQMLLLRTFLVGIPREVEEAAKIDGCNEFEVFVKVTLPLAKTIFMTVALLVFVDVWNEFLWANTFLMDDSIKTVATRVVRFIGVHSSDMAKIYTSCAITILPIVVLFLMFNRKFIEGMTSGSLKG